MSASPDVNHVIDSMKGRTVPASVTGVGAVMLVLGLVGVIYGFAVTGPAPTWGAILVGLVWSLGVCQGAFMLSIILTGTWGRWGRPLKRIAETFAFVMPVLWIVLAVFLFAGGIYIYKWHPTPYAPIEHIALEPHNAGAWSSKPMWLQHWFFAARLLISFAFLIVLDFVYLRAAMGPDMLKAKLRLGSAPAWWGRFMGNETDLQKAIDAGQKTQDWIFVPLGMSYAMIYSFMAFDLIMSLEPWWYTNMFGGWIFVSCVWTGLSAVGLTAMLSRDWLALGDFIKPKVTHDLGKLMLAACMFWAYTTFAQLLPIWYSNMPEETQFFLVRMGGEAGTLTAWTWMAQSVAVLCFIAPFTILLSRGIKKMRWPFAAICSLILFGIFMERSLLVMPQVYPDVSDVFPAVNFLASNVLIWFGFIGTIVLVVSNMLARIPPLVISDPHLGEHPWDQHIHSLDDHHGHAHG